MVGDWVTKYPDKVKALHDAGHEIQNHSDNHPHCNSLSSSEIISQLNACNDKVEEVTGDRPTLFRCPFGEYDDHVIESTREADMTPIQWDVDSLDWKGISADEIENRVLKRVENGSIILFHNAADHTPEALPGILENLVSQGYKVIPVSKLILPGTYGIDYTIDHTGRQFEAEDEAPQPTAEAASDSSESED